MPSYWEILRSNTFFGKETKIGFAVLAPKRWQWDIDNKVTYFNEEQRLLKLIVVEKGRLFLNGIPLTTTTMNQPGKYDNYYLYVIDREGKIFVTPKQINSENKIYHSSLLAGGTVLCAGYLKVENGFLKEIDKVTLDQVETVAKKYFVSSGLNLAIIGNFEDRQRFEKLLKL